MSWSSENTVQVYLGANLRIQHHLMEYTAQIPTLSTCLVGRISIRYCIVTHMHDPDDRALLPTVEPLKAYVYACMVVDQLTTVAKTASCMPPVTMTTHRASFAANAPWCQLRKVATCLRARNYVKRRRAGRIWFICGDCCAAPESRSRWISEKVSSS